MTNPNDSLPPDREAAYLQVAEQAIREATDPLVEMLSDLALADAVDLTLTAGDIDSLGIAEGFVGLLTDQNLAAEVVSAAEIILATGPASAAGEVNEQLALGNAEPVRGLTVNKLWALGQPPSLRKADGSWTKGMWRVNPEDDSLEFKSLSGVWISEADVDEGYGRWGGNISAQQAALAFEIRKAVTGEQRQSIQDGYQGVAQEAGGWVLDAEQAGRVWTGATHAIPVEGQLHRGIDEDIRALWRQGGPRAQEVDVADPTAKAAEDALDDPWLVRPASWPPIAELPEELL